MNPKIHDTFSRKLSYPGPVLLIDGLTGTGKTIFIKLINSTNASHAVSFNYALEQLCVSSFYKKIQSDAAVALIKLNIDQIRFDFNISREINFRIRDLSSIWRGQGKLNYLRNLFNNGNDDSQLYTNPKFVTFVVHQLLHTTEIMQNTYNSNFYKILCTRHPAYLYFHWKSYVDNHGTNARDITICKLINDNEIPWFIHEKSDNFFDMNLSDKSATAISELTDFSLNHIAANAINDNFIAIDFENFVLNPMIYMQKLSKWFNIDSDHMVKVLSEENIPRSQINQGPKKPIYLRYNSEKLSSNDSHEKNYQNLLASIKSEVSPEIWVRFLNSIEKYESVFPRWF